MARVVTLPIHEIIDELEERDQGDMEGLAASMAEIGLKHPILIRSSKKLVDGQRRLRAALALGWTEIDCIVDDEVDAWLARWRTNTDRKDLSPAEQVRAAERLVFTERITLDEAGYKAGISRKELVRARAVHKSGDQDLISRMESGEFSRKKAEAVAKLPAEERSKLLALPAEERQAAASELVSEEPSGSKSRAPRQVRPEKLIRRDMAGLGARIDDLESFKASPSDCDETRAEIAHLRERLDALEAKITPVEEPKTRKRSTKAVAERPDYPLVSDEDLDRRWRDLTHEQRTKAEKKAQAIKRAVDRHKQTDEPLLTCLEPAAVETGLTATTLHGNYYGRPGEPGLYKYPRPKWAQVLAPRWISGRGAAKIHPTAWDAWKAEYLRVEEPTLAQTYRVLEKLAAAHGWEVPASPKTLLSRLRREMHPAAIALARKGPRALLESRPAVMRDYQSIRVMGLWNADGRESDVMVTWPDGKEARPWITAWQDVRSRKIVGWRVDRSESSDSYRLALADAVREFGAPDAVLLDNSAGAASKMLTGGAHWRFKGGKPKPGEVAGLLTQLVGPKNIHWSKPYRGRSKPIERGFRDMALDLDKDYKLRGAYTGRSPAHKPDYGPGKKPVPVALEVYLETAAERIAEHNARTGRRGQALGGGSFDEAFAAGLAERADDPPARLSSAQMERWLLAPAEKVARAKDGEITLHGGRYCSEELSAALAGRPKAERTVVVRYDPDHLNREILVETRDGRLLARATPLAPTPFFDTQSAREAARLEGRLHKLAKEQLKTQKRMDNRELDRLRAEENGDTPEELPLAAAGSGGKLVTMVPGVATADPTPAARNGGKDNLLRMIDPDSSPSERDEDDFEIDYL